MAVDPKVAWAQLRSSAAGDGELEIPSFPSPAAAFGRALRFAIGPGGAPRFLVPIEQGSPPPNLTETRNLKFALLKGKASGVAGLYIDILCMDARLTSVFADFCEAIASRVEAGDDPGQAVKKTLDEFRALFDAPGSRVLSEAERVGLLGELWFLDVLAAHSPSRIEVWMGPLGQRHDFKAGSTAIEIKTASKKGVSRVTISSIEQLSAPSDGTLYLWHPIFEPTAGGAFSIGGLLASLLDRGVDKGALGKRLAALKLDLDALMKDETQGFTFEGVRAYRVVRGFPRIALEDIGGELPAGVLSVSYEIDLAQATSFALSPQEMEERISEFGA
jgi:hypothetical protein